MKTKTLFIISVLACNMFNTTHAMKQKKPTMKTVTGLGMGLKKDYVVEQNMLLTKKSSITGHGEKIILKNNSTIYIAKKSQLTISNATIEGNNIVLCSQSSKLILENVTWKLNNDYDFTKGEIIIKGKVSFERNGETSTIPFFIHKSPQSLNIQSQSIIEFKDNIGIVYDFNQDINIIKKTWDTIAFHGKLKLKGLSKKENNVKNNYLFKLLNNNNLDYPN